jgi:hypothetical protein
VWNAPFGVPFPAEAGPKPPEIRKEGSSLPLGQGLQATDVVTVALESLGEQSYEALLPTFGAVGLPRAVRSPLDPAGRPRLRPGFGVVYTLVHTRDARGVAVALHPGRHPPGGHYSS